MTTEYAPSTSRTNANNWCCIMDKPRVEEAAGDAGPSTSHQSTTLFKWLALNNQPALEDETPPASFYEVLGNAEVAFHCANCSRLLLSLDADALQRTIGTQTQVLRQLQLGQAQTQTQSQLGALQKQTQTDREASEEDLAMQAQLEWRLQQLQQQQQDDRSSLWPWLKQLNAFWSLLKTLLIWISVLNGCYLLCRGLWHLSIWQRPLMVPPPSSSLPALLYRKLCALARKLHII
ncbi:uncharacterized protein LOC117577977 [Drosophila albomicans]|uniref:Uncharacterized protein LOC117577977 n=1 Tax=Drosophila albomicans TaxID=7291 RepID=A0A6P8XQP1_DROAB|nr:uncharacterized protein LOC117577977 [Drosophila albomicans]XP_034118951.1 uncharacterized protein LOC117577977 [Drosophila albomicans]XP_034118952.1 uncharacterized protein LOC117577977 [Drosophila albomicans]